MMLPPPVFRSTRSPKRSTETPTYDHFLHDLHHLLDAHGIGAGSAYGLPLLPRAEADAGGDGWAEDAPVEIAIGHIQDYIDAHPGDDLSLERLSEKAHMSKYYFARVFKEATGRSPWRYVLEARVAHAKVLIEADVPLAEAALDAGFYDQSHFTHVFKQIEGMTPGDYREQAFEAAPDHDTD